MRPVATNKCNVIASKIFTVRMRVNTRHQFLSYFLIISSEPAHPLQVKMYGKKAPSKNYFVHQDISFFSFFLLIFLGVNKIGVKRRSC